MLNQGRVDQAGRVLVIDDDEIALESIRDVLAEAGFQVHCLTSPIGATQVIVSHGIDAVVVDLNMPVLRGDRFISLLRSWERIRDLPTILLSGASTETLEKLAQQMPGVQTVTKESMRRLLPLALRRSMARERAHPTSLRRATDLSSVEKGALASAAQASLKVLLEGAAGREIQWESLLHTLKLLRDHAQQVGTAQLVKLTAKLVEVGERCADRRNLVPDARLALRGALDFLTCLEGSNAGPRLPQMAAVHLSRLERVLEDLSK
ncbi:MAG: response regulator [Myxococcales bacterium]